VAQRLEMMASFRSARAAGQLTLWRQRRFGARSAMPHSRSGIADNVENTLERGKAIGSGGKIL
jgi:hypothetical protein